MRLTKYMVVTGSAVVAMLLAGARVVQGDGLPTDHRSGGSAAATAHDPACPSPGNPRCCAAPEFQDVSVHDPSVIRVGDSLYVFGSHLAAARTEDFVQWEMIADGVNEANPLFDNVLVDLAEVFDWTGEVGLWANDVIQLDDGRFYMYYNLSRLDSPRAAMGVAVADDVEGPYVAQGVFLRSGMWGEISEDGVNIYDPLFHPNVVDPDAFFDHRGDLWMIYGSYSGGIFILEMDPETGMPLPGQGYGTHLMGGNHSRIEGAYVLYSPDTQYYYMFTSFGGLSADGGYNVRVSRALEPDGPYYDALGNDMADVMSDPTLPLFDDASIEPFGQKLMGSHLFARRIGDPGTGIGVGYVSPGHNSAYYDEATGRYFLIFHTRFPLTGEFHQVRVHEMFMNADGWPVVAPHRWAPCDDGGPPHSAGTVRRSQIPGDYYLVNHGKDISAELKTSTFARLLPNGRITGEVSGHWYYRGQGRVNLSFDGDSSLYVGMTSRQWSEFAEDSAVTLTATSDEGVSVWGTQLERKSPRSILNDIVADLELPGTECGVTEDLNLPTEATRQVAIQWSSSDPDHIAADGSVVRPEAGEGDAVVTLTAEMHLYRRTASKDFDVVVRERSASGLILHYPFDGNLTDVTTSCSGTVSGGFIDLPGGQITYGPGVAGQAAVFDGASGVRMRDALINGYSYSVALWVNPSALTPFTTTFFGARDPNSWVSVLPMGHGFVDFHTMVWSGVAWYDADTGLNIPGGAWSHLAFTVDQGELRVYVDGVLTFAGGGFPDVFTGANGIFSLGVNWWDTPYAGSMDDLRVYERALTLAEISALAATGP